MKWRSWILRIWLLGTLAGAYPEAAVAQDLQAGAPGNTMCPVMTDEPIDPEIFTEFQYGASCLCVLEMYLQATLFRQTMQFES